MSLKCVHIDAGLRIHTDGTYSPCCVARGVVYKDEKGTPMNVKTHTFDDAYTSPTLQEIREAFKNGEKHKACSDCWQEEALGKMSKRVRDLGKTKGDSITYNKPHLLELNLGNFCNLACRMCTLGASVNWKKEFNLTREDNQQLSEIELDIIARAHNNSFIDESLIWEQLHSNMKYVRWIDMYGGEPMMMKKQWDALRFSVENGYAKNQRVHFNTNGTIFKQEYVELLSHFEHVGISFSIDGTDKHFEYIRYPATWNVVEENMEKWLEATKNLPNFKFDICFTYQVLNILNYGDIAAWAKSRNLLIYRNAVYAPEYYNISNIKEELKDNIAQKIREQEVLFPEIKKEWEELIDHMYFQQSNISAWEKFVKVTEKLDKSRNQNFKELFPLEARLFNI